MTGKSRPREGRPPLAPHSALSGVSNSALQKLAKLGVHGPFDLVLHLPLRYEDETRIYPINAAPPAQTVQVQGTIAESDIKYRPRRQLVCKVEDESGSLYVRFFNFYPSLTKALAVGARVRLLGEVRPGFFGAEMVHPKCRVVHADQPLPQSLTPVYPTTAGLSQDLLRKLIQARLNSEDLSETLPEKLLQRLKLPGFMESVVALHNPPPQALAASLAQRTHPAWERMKFDELLAQQLSLRLHYRQRRGYDAPSLPPRHRLSKALLDRLPFRLTMAQKRVIAEISRDLSASHPMQRLLQGDVGSGKTIVAAIGALQTIENGYQAAIMAPTEILAEQHFRQFSEWLEKLDVNIAWLSGGLKKKEKDAALKQVADGGAQLVIGTHALFQDEVRFHNLGFAIIDEQQRFGVHQRLALRLKARHPHQLMMSATPIPRTLSMSYYADLDVSVIDELPPGRAPVATRLVADTRREQVVARVRDACMEGRQAYWVCPLIEESEALQLQTALDTYATLVRTFPELKVGLIHGRLAEQEKTAVMEALKKGGIQLLVATTVIEVGVDVANASLMVIEHAERMGLAQLHQLRGRVGRGAAQSACILLYQTPLSEAARQRLRIIYETRDGFEIARRDLMLRGPGEFLGARQSGVPMLRFADINHDQDLLDAASKAAGPLLDREPQAARRHLARWMGTKQLYLKV